MKCNFIQKWYIICLCFRLREKTVPFSMEFHLCKFLSVIEAIMTLTAINLLKPINDEVLGYQNRNRGSKNDSETYTNLTQKIQILYNHAIF